MTTPSEIDTQEARSVQQVDRPPAGTERDKKEWWAVVENGVMRVTGHGYGTSPGYWWCPKAGYSGAEGIHLFETEKAALEKLLAEAEREAVKWKERVEKVKARLATEKLTD